MDKLTKEEIAYSVALLTRYRESRDISQGELEKKTGIAQSTISKIEKGTMSPSAENLEKLFDALGLRLSNILADSEAGNGEIQGYFATPLTGLNQQEDQEVRRVVSAVKSYALDAASGDLPFQLYWPGDHTHPKQHAAIPAKNVYLVDRSRASTYDFILLFCATPSFGVGQENEIAAQSCTPAIRLIPENGLSRMMLGSFLNAIDVPYKGSLATGIALDQSAIVAALQEVRISFFRQKALSSGADMSDFGARLSDLIVSRCGGNFQQFASDVGISLDYLTALRTEHFLVANPSARLLGRIAARLSVRISYILGESDDCDPIWVESNDSWRKWIQVTPGLDAKRTLQVRDDWRQRYRENLREQTASRTSFRSRSNAMSQPDWQRAYDKAKGPTKDSSNGSLF